MTDTTCTVTWRDGRQETFVNQGAPNPFEISLDNPKWQDLATVTFSFGDKEIGTVYFGARL